MKRQRREKQHVWDQTLSKIVEFGIRDQWNRCTKNNATQIPRCVLLPVGVHCGVLRWCFSTSRVSFESEAKSTPNMLKKIPEMISFLVWVWNPCGNIPLSLFRYRRHVHVTSNGLSLFFSSLRFSSLRFSSLKPWPSISTLWSGPGSKRIGGTAVRP